MLDLLIHTSDTVKYNRDRNLWTPEMVELDRGSNMKQGYIQTVRPAGFKWGKLENDPKQFLHILIPDNQFNPAWLERLFNVAIDGEEEDIQDALWKFDIQKILSRGEYDALINIPFNDNSRRPAIVKDIQNASSLIELIDWNKEKNRVPLRLHGSAGDFDVEEDGGGDYTALRTAVEAQASDISGGSSDANFHINLAWDNDDLGNWDIDGWTMGSNNMLIETTGDARHSGTTYSTTVHRIEHTGEAFDIETANVTVDGIEATATSEGIDASNGLTGITVKNCLINFIGSGGVGAYRNQGNTVVYINDIAYNTGTVEAASEGFVCSSGSSTWLNCTSMGLGAGMDDDGGTSVARNCAVFNNDTDFENIDTIDFCASDDVSGTNAVDISPAAEVDGWNAAFTSYSTGDLSVKDASSVIENAGTDLSGSDVTDDIIGTARPQDSVYDIGAFEFIVAGEAPTFIPEIRLF